jgi:hypothetical protein
MHKTTYTALLIVIFSLFMAFGIKDTTTKIDTTFVITADITRDEKDDSLVIHVTGESWKKPFTTEYTIISNNKTILSESSTDDAIDQDFGDPNMMDWCKEYIPCKKDWYFTRLKKNAVVIIQNKKALEKELLDEKSDMSIPALARQYYINNLKMPKKKAKAESLKLFAMLKKKDIVLIVLPVLPVHRSFPRFYDPLHKNFIQLFGF